MSTQLEQILENNLVNQLVKLGYDQIIIKDENELINNLKIQIQKHNAISLSAKEFIQILNFINKGNVYDRSKILRDRVPYTSDQGDTKTVELLNQIHWCQNEFQVTHQVSMTGTYKNRYDVTILINGLPLVQIELKRRGLELKEAFNQTNRYERHSYWAGHGLFQFVQFFVISNGVNTKYYANSPLKARSFKQTFYWADRNNNLITQLADFSEVFLERCHLAKMITKYTVVNESDKLLMILRPYQFYAVEAIVEQVKTTTKNGYIWHTTGSGKTLTSFKTAQLLTNSPEAYKVVFVVDRKDLDYQTTKEFNAFSKGSIDGTNNTDALVKQLLGDNKLIVTTIQKLNGAINKKRYHNRMETLKDKRIVFIFDECHRSQFGDTHKALNAYFSNCQMFGFTGTPIFKDNASSNQHGKRTTKMLFGECLHKYVITDAIRDKNVLKFSVEYIRTFKKKDDILDIEVEAIDECEVMESPIRLNNITEYIIENHNRKTHNREFTAIFCISNVKTLIEYYKLLLQKKKEGKHNLRLATIFSYSANEDDKGAVGFVEDSEFLDIECEKQDTPHTRDQLEEFIVEYNQQYGTNFTSANNQSFYNYYNDVSRRVKNRQVDILVVVNMFLTGFDSKHLNTLYVDKNLKHHGLIQAYSRTNRILNDLKSQGNIVCFRNLKAATDEAITLFSNKEAIDEIIIEPYEEYVSKFNQAFLNLLQITPTVNSVNNLQSEDDELNFIKAFREIIRIKNVLTTFTEFKFDDLSMPEQLFEDYKSKYLDLYDKTKTYNQKQKASILEDVDFELELIHRDEINVAYILKLLSMLQSLRSEDQQKQKQAILDIINSDVQLRSKRELIEKFITRNLTLISDPESIPEEFEAFVYKEQQYALKKLSNEENLDEKKLQDVISNYLFTEKKPFRDELIGMLNVRPTLKQRAPIAQRLTDKIMNYVETFINGMSG